MATAGSNRWPDQVAIAHRVWIELLNRMLELEGKARDRDARLELLRYQVRELSGARAQGRRGG